MISVRSWGTLVTDPYHRGAPVKKTISQDDIKAICKILEIDPGEWTSISIDPEGARLERYRRDEDGKFIIANREPVTEMVTISCAMNLSNR